jgi:hypothetical protein
MTAPPRCALLRYRAEVRIPEASGVRRMFVTTLSRSRRTSRCRTGAETMTTAAPNEAIFASKLAHKFDKKPS